VLGYLADRGVPQDELDRIRVPAGLDLGRTTHQEIAVAILAELVQLRASGALARSVTTPQAFSVDPVCGMTVAATAASRPLRHDGVDYYFCCAGCRQAFEQDPDAYIRRETRC
jgi:xanthine dehydrogenase accessory factor